jgi:hypothetical protein
MCPAVSFASRQGFCFRCGSAAGRRQSGGVTVKAPSNALAVLLFIATVFLSPLLYDLAA